MENVMIWGRFKVHHEADRNSVNFCQLIPTHYAIQQIIIIWADKRVEDEGYEMNNEWHKQAGSKFQGVSPVER